MSKYRMFSEKFIPETEEVFFEEEDIYFSKIEEDMFDLVHKGNYDSLCSRIKNGTSVNLRNDKDQTLLHYAFFYNQVKIAKLLISLGADLDAKDKFGQTVRDAIQKHNQSYSQLDKHIEDFYQPQMKEEIIESHVIGSSEDNFSWWQDFTEESGESPAHQKAITVTSRKLACMFIDEYGQDDVEYGIEAYEKNTRKQG